ncbi:MAG: hypothetical protein ACI965_000925 [Paraglaciecola sp.]|jgi:hypothetical protein
MQAFGDHHQLTPHLDAMKQDSLFFNKLYGTGSRTTSGLEALSLSILSSPGRSVVKRPEQISRYNIATQFGAQNTILRFYMADVATSITCRRLFPLALKGERNVCVLQNDSHSLSIALEYFKRASENIGLYSKARWVSAKNQYQGRPNVLGGQSGVRGYPLHYQYADHNVQLRTQTTEMLSIWISPSQYPFN